MYERILPFYGLLRQRSLCWLRLFPSPEGLVVIYSEVPGNPGTSVTNALEGVVRATADAYGIAPDELTVFEHYPLDGEGVGAGEYDQVRLRWQRTPQGFRLVDMPAWVPVERVEVETKVLHDLTPRAFWQPLQIPASYGRPALERWVCEVGGRRGDAWRPLPKTMWLATVLDYQRGEWDEGGFQARAEAQAWVLNRLAQLAGEFDSYPDWLTKN